MADEHHPEIVIIKRYTRHADEHHGGAWKIAFADFMTAMMALFLVLWLISSTSEKQKRALAQYFNPVKLVDMTTIKKGFHDPKETDMGTGTQTDSTPSEKGAPEPRSRPERTEKDRTRDETLPTHSRVKPLEGRDEKSRDALAPTGHEARERAMLAARPTEPAPVDLAAAFTDPFATVPSEPQATAEPEPAESENQQRFVSSDGQPPSADAAAADSSRSPAQRASRSESDEPENVSRPVARAPSDADLETLASKILEVSPPDGAKQSAPKLEVRVTDEGVLISLTDAVNDTMFAIGSAEPHRKTIEVVQRIAQILATRPGTIIVRGHTDARPYRSGAFDNWRLSTARAHAARELLVRGGLVESRIERVEGYADRSPKVATDPAAPENRRIEILLRKGKS